MLSFLTKQIIKRYKPAIVAIISKDFEPDPAPAIAVVLSDRFTVSSPAGKIRTKNDAIGGILNAFGQSYISQLLRAFSLLWKNHPRWPEVILLRISEKRGFKQIENLSEFLKFDFIVILPDAARKENSPDMQAVQKFFKKNTRVIAKLSDKNSLPAVVKKNCKIITYSSPSADIFSSDMVFQSNGGVKGVSRFGISFKINYKGSVLPVRISKSVNEKEVCNILIAALMGLEMGMNLVEIASSFEKYQPVNGMKVIEGIKKSAIIDDAANYDLNTVFEALKSLPKLKSGRKLIVLGDILGLGFEAEARHREIGKQIFALKPDTVFLVGNRINFTADELRRSRFPAERIFKFDDADHVEKILQPKIQEDDLILIAGSKEIGLRKLVKQIMANPPVR